VSAIEGKQMATTAARPAVPLPRPGRRRVAVVAADDIFARRLLAATARADVDVAGAARAADGLAALGPADVLVVATGGDLEHALDALRRHAPRALVVAIALEDGGRGVRGALSAGADAVVLESEVDEALPRALAAVDAAHLVLPRAVRGTLAKPVLSQRERQIAGLVVLGLTNTEIARQLHLAETTVKSHLTSIFRKLGVRSRSEASARILDPRDGLGVGVLALAPAEGLDVVDVP
jgi:DNA-binding NarL/FixJ family response regulator